MDARPVINWDKLPRAPERLRLLYESGYGRWSVSQAPDNRPIVVMYSFSLDDYEAMGPEERQRLGVEDEYQYTLAHGAPLEKNDTDEV
jgi:hypothetical protein